MQSFRNDAQAGERNEQDSMIEKVNVKARIPEPNKQDTRAIQLMKTRQQRNATTVATNIDQVETIVRHGANIAVRNRRTFCRPSEWRQ